MGGHNSQTDDSMQSRYTGNDGDIRMVCGKTFAAPFMQTKKSSNQKRWILRTVGALAVSLLVFALFMVRGVYHHSWVTFYDGDINRLAKFVEWYRDANDRYPDSLSELLQDTNTFGAEDGMKYLKEKLPDRPDRHWEYHSSTNGFTIIVTKPSKLFSKGERMERHFIKGFNP